MSKYPDWKRRKKLRMLWEQKGICHWCREPMTLDRPATGKLPRSYATFDELLPRSRGGTRTRDNQVLACKHCNEQRGNIIPAGVVREYVAVG